MKIFLTFLLVALIVEVVLIAPGQLFDGDELVSSVEPSIIEKSEKNLGKADQFMKGVHLTGTKEGEREWELWAEKAKGFNQQKAWRLDIVKSNFFSDEGGTLFVNGDSGEVELESKNLIITGNVVVRSSNGYKLYTSKAEYTSNSKTLISPKKVKVIGPAEPGGSRLGLVGDGMRATLSNSYIWIIGNVKADKVLRDGRVLNIRSDEARISGSDNSVKFVGHVVLDLDNMRAAGPTANFQYKEDGKSLESVFIDGGVKVSDLDKWATAKNVTVNFDEDKYTFVGSPRVVQGEDELRGEKIIFTEGGQRVKVLKARAKVGKRALGKDE